jgi:4-amino-4-deoxy-L-arabinose transferase-like glycosyltransferase
VINDRKSLAWILAATIAPLLLFIHKPFHIDDSAFLEVAENILKHPFDPYHGAIALVDNDYHVFRTNGIEPNTFESMSHPPLVSYVMAVVIKLFGRVSEIPLHAVFMIFPIAAAIAAFSLAERFTKVPRTAALFLVASPIFIVNAQNLMTDVPMLAFTLGSIAFFVHGVDKQRISFLIAAGVLAGLAALTRYVGPLTIPIFFAYALLNEKGSKPALISTLCAFAVFAIWLVQNFAVYGTAHLTASYSFYKFFYAQHQKTNLVKSVCDFSALGGLSLLCAIFIASLRKKNSTISIFSALAASLILLWLLKTRSAYLVGYTTLMLYTLCLFLSAGLYLIAEALDGVIQNTKRKKTGSEPTEDILFLFIWFSLSLLSALFMLPFGTARYMLPSLFPLLLILFAGMDLETQKTKSVWLNLCIVGTFIGSIVISFADFEYALTYKTFARNAREIYRTERLWFIGEWGFRYYMKEVGANYLLSNDLSPSTGDVIIKPEIAGLHEMHPSVADRCSKFDPYIVKTPDPIRIMNPIAKAGFYAHGYGLLPFSISTAPLEEFEVCRIKGP